MDCRKAKPHRDYDNSSVPVWSEKMKRNNSIPASAWLVAICFLLAGLLLPLAGRAQVQTVTIPVGNGPIALALNQTTHMLYVANQSANSVSVIDTNAANATFNTVV